MRKAILIIESKPDKKGSVTFTVEFTDRLKPETTRKAQYHGSLSWHKKYWQNKGFTVGVRPFSGKKAKKVRNEIEAC